MANEENNNDPNNEPNQVIEEKPKVDKSAYDAVSNDMHKYKGNIKILEAKIAQMEADNSSRETATLEQNKEFQRLYELEQAKNAELNSSLAEKSEKFIKSHKLNAVKEAVGGFKKKEYVKFIDTSKILVDDNGLVDENSVKNEVDRIRKEFPELLTKKSGKLPPSDAPNTGSEPQSKMNINNMSVEQMNEYRRKLLEAKYQS